MSLPFHALQEIMDIDPISCLSFECAAGLEVAFDGFEEVVGGLRRREGEDDVSSIEESEDVDTHVDEEGCTRILRGSEPPPYLELSSNTYRLAGR
jgi:hypothetical protein